MHSQLNVSGRTWVWFSTACDIKSGDARRTWLFFRLHRFASLVFSRMAVGLPQSIDPAYSCVPVSSAIAADCQLPLLMPRAVRFAAAWPSAVGSGAIASTVVPAVVRGRATRRYRQCRTVAPGTGACAVEDHPGRATGGWIMDRPRDVPVPCDAQVVESAIRGTVCMFHWAWLACVSALFRHAVLVATWLLWDWYSLFFVGRARAV